MINYQRDKMVFIPPTKMSDLNLDLTDESLSDLKKLSEKYGCSCEEAAKSIIVDILSEVINEDEIPTVLKSKENKKYIVVNDKEQPIARLEILADGDDDAAD